MCIWIVKTIINKLYINSMVVPLCTCTERTALHTCSSHCRGGVRNFCLIELDSLEKNKYWDTIVFFSKIKLSDNLEINSLWNNQPYTILACRPSAGNLGASGAGPSGPHLRRACGWPFGPARRQGRLSPKNEFWLFLALFGTFWPIFFVHFFPLTNCDKSLQ